MLKLYFTTFLLFIGLVAFSQTISGKSDSIRLKRTVSIIDTSSEKGQAEFEVLVNAIGKVIQAEPIQSTLSKELTQFYRKDLENNIIIEHKTGENIKTKVIYKK